MFIAFVRRFVPLAESLAASPKTCTQPRVPSTGERGTTGAAVVDDGFMTPVGQAGIKAFFPEESVCTIGRARIAALLPLLRSREARRKMARSRFPLVHHRSLVPQPLNRFNVGDGPKDGTWLAYRTTRTICNRAW